MFKETGDSKYVYRNESNKVCFNHDMAYADLPRRIITVELLHDNIARNPKCHR